MAEVWAQRLKGVFYVSLISELNWGTPYWRWRIGWYSVSTIYVVSLVRAGQGQGASGQNPAIRTKCAVVGEGTWSWEPLVWGGPRIKFPPWSSFPPSSLGGTLGCLCTVTVASRLRLVFKLLSLGPLWTAGEAAASLTFSLDSFVEFQYRSLSLPLPLSVLGFGLKALNLLVGTVTSWATPISLGSFKPNPHVSASWVPRTTRVTQQCPARFIFLCWKYYSYFCTQMVREHKVFTQW
jgi:hypothetical protein